MTNLRFNIYLMLLAATFVGLAFAAEQNADYLRQLSFWLRMALAFVTAAPFMLSILLYMLRLKELRQDEYQAHLLQQRMAFATMAALFYTIFMGFTERYGPDAGVAVLYILPALAWYGAFAVSGLFGSEKP